MNCVASAAGTAVAMAADTFIGTRFRLHGRDPATGLDCVGLVEASLVHAGHTFRAPMTYGLRNTSVANLVTGLGACPARRVPNPYACDQPGDILLCSLGCAQHHLLIVSHAAKLCRPAFIHAHAGLRRVVRTPGPPAWPVIARWRVD